MRTGTYISVRISLAPERVRNRAGRHNLICLKFPTGRPHRIKACLCRSAAPACPWNTPMQASPTRSPSFCRQDLQLKSTIHLIRVVVVRRTLGQCRHLQCLCVDYLQAYLYGQRVRPWRSRSLIRYADTNMTVGSNLRVPSPSS